MDIAVLYLIPLLTGILCFIPTNFRWPGYIQIVGMLALLGMVFKLMGGAAVDAVSVQGFRDLSYRDLIHIDALSLLLLLIISLVGVLASIYASGYMVHEEEEGPSRDLSKLKRFYALFNLFILSMLVMVTTNNLGVFWIFIEASTLFSAFLVGYYNRKEPVEAAWKYIILCTVGIAFALIGLTLGYYAVIHCGGDEAQALNWDYLISMATRLDPGLMKAAFVFVLIGFGTKAGFAPLHSWLPDAYSQAPAPVSALLSGALCKCVIYGILRYGMVANLAIGGHFANQFLVFFGLLSLAVATPFILAQRNMKRLLAYSSLEHIGIITVGLGFGTPLAIFGALFHMLNHALVKSLMFFTAGNVALKYHSQKMTHARGVIRMLPVGGMVLLVGGLALAGAPPFSVFLSEFYIIAGGWSAGYRPETLLLLFLLIIVFGGLAYHFIQMAVGPAPVPVSGSKGDIVRGEINRSSLVASLLPLGLLLMLGVWQPAPLLKVLHQAEQMIDQGLSRGGLPG